MKFYEKIIGLNKNAPSDELIITFSDNGFEFNHHLYLNNGKKLSLDGNSGSAIMFRNSLITISDLNGYSLRFSGNSKTILFNFQTGNIDISTWNLGTIYSTNGNFNYLLPSGANKYIGTSDNRWENIFTKQISCTGITTQSLYVRTLNIDPIDSTTNPLVLPRNSEITRSLDNLHVAGADVGSTLTTIYGGVKYYYDSTWNNTGRPVNWRYLLTTDVDSSCYQFFTKIDLTSWEHRDELLIPLPYGWMWKAGDYFQISYSRDPGVSTAGPYIIPYVGYDQKYVQVKTSSLTTYLYIQMTRFD